MNQTRLVTLSGSEPNQLSVLNINPKNLSDWDAGLIALKVISDIFPGITWNQLMDTGDPQQLSGWWTDFKGVATSIYEGGKTFISDIWGGVADSGGSMMRLISDPEVSESVQTAAAAYFSGGQSLSMDGFMDSLGIESGSPEAKVVENFVNQAGITYKGSSGFNADWVMYGGAAVLVVGLVWVFAKRGKKK